MIYAVASALISALSIAICAAAPEFIWQGLWIALDHFSWADLVSALLIGVILAFFVDPLMGRLQDLLHRTRSQNDAHGPQHDPLFRVSVSLAFALASVCVHDAMSAFASDRAAGHAGAPAGLAAAIELTVASAIVPFAITLAWLSVRNRWLALPMGIIGGASSGVAGWLFSWSAQEVFVSTICCLLILGLGYRQAIRGPSRDIYTRCARSVALVAAIGLTTALLLDTALRFLNINQFRLYSPFLFWVDIRFYLGWTIGLLLAPSPYAAGDPAKGRFGAR
jgi:hypothetical protein